MFQFAYVFSFFLRFIEGGFLMEKAKEITAEVNLADSYLEDYDFEVEERLMLFGDIVTLADTDDFWVVYDEDDSIVISFAKRGFSIRLTYLEWEELRNLLTTGENPEELDRVNEVQINHQGKGEYNIYFPHNALNLLLRRGEFVRLKLMVLGMGSPYPWDGKSQLATA
jgi:hypothetical protein